jgi:hypothetical protein
VCQQEAFLMKAANKSCGISVCLGKNFILPVFYLVVKIFTKIHTALRSNIRFVVGDINSYSLLVPQLAQKLW